MDYNLINKQLESVIETTDDKIANYANASSILFYSLENVNWAGFYFLKNDSLVLGPFQGKVACTILPKNKGVCWACVNKEETVIVENVHNFTGHIACDSASVSEIVVPIKKENKIIGVLDIDSTKESNFDSSDRIGLEKFIEILKEKI